MNRLSAQNQLIIGIVIIVAVSLAGIFLAIKPQFERATRIDGEISQVESDIQAQRAIVARRLSAKAQAADAQVEMLRIANEVPEGPELPTVIVNLQDVANAAGLTFAQIAPGEPAPAVDATGKQLGYTKIPITVTVQGKWDDHIEYLRRIAKLERGVRITDASYTYVAPTDTKDAYVEGVIKLEVYTMSIVQPSVSTGGAQSSTPATPPAGATQSGQ
ncbi:MAG: type 4a pilus biogenesis protein PilO [Coriobacteriia bacterium]|nr:type 4a pilus biogenesis protein PilO [Coriobacteriia bacterium]